MAWADSDMTSLGIKHTYWVQSGLTHSWNSDWFNPAVAFLDGVSMPAAPAAPSGLTATSVSVGQINLGWTDNSNNETGFTIDRATDSGFTQNLTSLTVSANTTSYSDTDSALNAGTAYYYRVRATNNGTISADTTTASVTTQGIQVIMDDTDASGVTITGPWQPPLGSRLRRQRLPARRQHRQGHDECRLLADVSGSAARPST